jgi:hypothetical protein
MPKTHATSAREFSPTLWSMTLIGPRHVGSIYLSRPEAQLIRVPHEVRSSDDVPLLYRPRMAREVRRFSVESGVELPPVAAAGSAYGPGQTGLYRMDECHEQ